MSLVNILSFKQNACSTEASMLRELFLKFEDIMIKY